MMKDRNAGVAFLLRKTSLSLEEIGRLVPQQFEELIREVHYQDSVAQYQTAMYVGNILAALANNVPRKGNRTYKARDFVVMKEPKRPGAEIVSGSKEELEALAKRFSIKLPSREMVDI